MTPDPRNVARRYRASQMGPDAYSVFGDYLEAWPVPLASRLPEGTRVVLQLDGKPYQGQIVGWKVFDNDVARYAVQSGGTVLWPKVADVYLSLAEMPHG